MTSILNTNPFGFVFALGVVGFDFGCDFFLDEPYRKSSASRSFFEESFVRPVVSTVRAVGAAGTVPVGDLGVGEVRPSPPPNKRSIYN